jgi:peptide/nickel transport system substrate-binding protein/oligopeptide transport system substrate-binding protein
MRRPLALVLTIAASAALFLGLTLSGRPGQDAADARKLRVPIPVDPVSLDPVEIADVYQAGVAARIFSTLVRHSPKLEVVPDLAESWTVSPDGLTYTFRLRRGARFHNGRAATAADALWSLNRLADPRVSRKTELVEELAGVAERLAAHAGYMSARAGRALSEAERAELERMMDPAGLPGLAAPDAQTLVVRLRRPWPPLLHQLAMVPAAVVPREEVGRPGRSFARRPCGTGPFALTEWRENERLYLEGFERYFGGEPRLGAVEYLVIREPAMAFRRYEKGELDMCEIPLGRLREVRGRRDFHSWPQLTTSYLGIAMNREPLGSNLHLRRALNLALDRERLCRVILEGRAVPARGVLPPGMPGYRPGLAGWRFDPPAARRELEAAGYGGGKGLAPVPLYYRSDRDGRRAVVEIQAQFAAAGIPVELRAVDWAHLKDLTRREPPALFRIAWVGDYPDPDNFLYVLFHSSRAGQTNRAHYRSAAADALLDAARALPAGPERLAAYARAEELIVADAPWVFVCHQSANLLVNPEVRGLVYTPLDSGTDLAQTDFSKVSKEQP